MEEDIDMTDEDRRAIWIGMKHVNNAIKGRDVVSNLAASLEQLLPMLGEPTTDEEREILKLAQEAIEASKK